MRDLPFTRRMPLTRPVSVEQDSPRRTPSPRAPRLSFSAAENHHGV
jgi:hypothetical protein